MLTATPYFYQGKSCSGAHYYERQGCRLIRMHAHAHEPTPMYTHTHTHTRTQRHTYTGTHVATYIYTYAEGTGKAHTSLIDAQNF